MGGGRATITGFSSGPDKIDLAGYGKDEVANALKSQHVVDGSDTIKLSDHTTITFVGISQLTASDFITPGNGGNGNGNGGNGNGNGNGNGGNGNDHDNDGHGGHKPDDHGNHGNAGHGSHDGNDHSHMRDSAFGPSHH